MPYDLPGQVAAYGSVATSDLFGGNVLAPRTTMTGEGSYAEAVQGLNVSGLRFPGGSLTEYYFDISDPDSGTAIHAVTGEETQFIPISDFMSYAGSEGMPVTIVIPTRDQLSDATDENGDRIPQIDEEALRDFVHDVASGVYGEAEIAAFELGNEYWGSGEMSAVEYGRLAADMAEIIADELSLVSEVHGLDTSDISVLAQMGQNYGYSCLSDNYEGWDSEDILDDLMETYPDAGLSYDNIRGNGDVNWSEVNNALIRMGFDTEEEQDALDGLIAHVYSRGTESSRHYDLDVIQNSWLEQEGFEHLQVHVTEWNMKATSGEAGEDYGLLQAHEMLEIMEEFMAAGVDQAHVWPLIQNTSNALSLGFDYSGNTAPGEMFSMMSQHLPGKAMIDFTPGGDRDTELETPEVDVHAFAGGGDMVFYIASNSDRPEMTDLGLSGLVSGFGSMEVSVLGVEDGAAAGDTKSVAMVEILDPSEIYQNGTLQVDLDAHEIMQVVIRDVVPTDDFAPVLESIEASLAIDEDAPDDADAIIEELIPLLPPESEEETEGEDDDGEGDASEDGGWGGVGMALALLPILGMFGL